MLRFLTFALSVLIIGNVAQQNILECQFIEDIIERTDYTCLLRGISVNGTDNVVISGTHQLNRTNVDVRNIRVVNSTMPIILPQLFQTFPYAVGIEITSSGLQDIQTNSFIYARNLQVIKFNNNPVDSVYEGVFSMLYYLRVLQLSQNNISYVNKNAFQGLFNLQDLDLSHNQIYHIEVDTFKPISKIQFINLGNNLLTEIENDLLKFNSNLTSIILQNNRINAIAPDFIKTLNLGNLQVLVLNHNKCVNASFFRSVPWLRTLEDGLQQCFANFNVTPEVEKTFVLHLKGELSITDETGKEIIRI
ncbi:unnamed protein product [Diamesa hyperborea]